MFPASDDASVRSCHTTFMSPADVLPLQSSKHAQFSPPVSPRPFYQRVRSTSIDEDDGVSNRDWPEISVIAIKYTSGYRG